MEDVEHHVYDCNIEIKSEPDDHNDEFNETNTCHEIGTEPSSPITVRSDKSTIPCYSFNSNDEKNEIDTISEQDSAIPSNSRNCQIEEKEKKIISEQESDKSDIPYDSNNCVAQEKEAEIVSERDSKEGVVKYCSESDPNDSYVENRKLLEGICILEAQRAQVIKNLNELFELQKQALSDPDIFVKRLQNRKGNFSTPSKIPELPEIDWSKYELNFNAFRVRTQQTKLAAKVSDLTKSGMKRKCDENYSPTKEVRRKQHQRAWTAEEKKKLEELLIRFPAEPVQARRWEKIADCLEGRTPGQIASRVQKYFSRLMQHGMPIPGKKPSTVHLEKCHDDPCVMHYSQSSSMVPPQPPVYIPDFEDNFDSSCSQSPSTEGNAMESTMDASGEEDINPNLNNLPEYEKFKLLEKALKEKQRPTELSHIGYKERDKHKNRSGKLHLSARRKRRSGKALKEYWKGKHEFDQHSSDHHLQAILKQESK